MEGGDAEDGSSRPPPRPTGFRGKQPKRKFARSLANSTERKDTSKAQASGSNSIGMASIVAVGDGDMGEVGCTEGGGATRRSRRAKRKTSKSELAEQLRAAHVGKTTMKKEKVVALLGKKRAQRKVAKMRGNVSAASDAVRVSRRAAREAKMMAPRAEREAKQQSEKNFCSLLDHVKSIAAELGVSKSYLLTHLDLVFCCHLTKSRCCLLITAGIIHSSCCSNRVGAHSRDSMEG